MPRATRSRGPPRAARGSRARANRRRMPPRLPPRMPAARRWNMACEPMINRSQLWAEPAGDARRAATVVAEPLERGFGLTLGNALRRILLSSLQGAAVTSLQIEGVLHEFFSLPGVLEDVTDIVLNVKNICLRMHGEGPKRMRMRATGPGEVPARQIETGHAIQILNPHLVICPLAH